MSKNETIINYLEQAVLFGDLVPPLLEQAKQAPFLSRATLIVSGLFYYTLHKFYLEAARQAQNETLCVFERINSFQIQKYDSQNQQWEEQSTQAVNLSILDPAVNSAAQAYFAESGSAPGYIDNDTNQLAQLYLSHVNLLRPVSSCASQILTAAGMPVPADPPLQPIGCLTIAGSVNVRSHPTGNGRVLGGVTPALHPGVYTYYDTQSDSNTNTDSGKWYQVAPLGYGKQGYAMWIRDRVGSETYLTNIHTDINNCQSPTMLGTLGNPITNDTLPTITLNTELFGGFQNYEEILAFILACESDYEISAAQDIAYVIRSRMMSDKFPDTWEKVIRQVAQWQCWGDEGRVADYRNASGPRRDAVNQIISDIVPSIEKMPPGGLGTLGFPPSTPKLEYALYTLGDAIYGLDADAYRQNPVENKLTNAEVANAVASSSTFVPGSCLPAADLENIYIDHSLISDNDLVTIYFSEAPNCVFPT